MRLPSDIPGALSVAECTVLGDLARTATAALEVGHYYGRSTAVLLQNLPHGCPLTTIDHHRGDRWSNAAPVDEFERNVRPSVGTRPFAFHNAPFQEVLPTLAGPYDFVFYDADHTADAVETFWDLVQPLLAPSCTLVYDDGDWEDQSLLAINAATGGFVSVRTRGFVRGDRDKRSPETYTLEVLTRP